MGGLFGGVNGIPLPRMIEMKWEDLVRGQFCKGRMSYEPGPGKESKGGGGGFLGKRWAFSLGGEREKLSSLEISQGGKGWGQP